MTVTVEHSVAGSVPVAVIVPVAVVVTAAIKIGIVVEVMVVALLGRILRILDALDTARLLFDITAVIYTNGLLTAAAVIS